MSFGTIPPLSAWKRWQPTPPVLAAWGVLLAVILWTYWGTILHVVKVWYNTPDYGHGFFVPLFSCYLLWLRQEMVDPWPKRGSWWGLAFLAVWGLARWAIVFLRYERDIDSLFPFLIGLTLVLGGWRALRWAWPSILFLIFMVPLPDRVSALLSHHLQRLAALISAYVLQTVGVPAIVGGEYGTVIQLSSEPLEVARACSGLRMLSLFFAICVGASFILKLRVWEKIVLIISAVPIAVISNVMRIVLDGVLTEWVSPEAGHLAHDRAGVLMMVPAMLMLWGELSLIKALLIEPSTEGPLTFGGEAAARRRSNPPLAAQPRPPVDTPPRAPGP